jgi:hypothetical protein
MDSGEREQEARQHADEQHNARQAAAGQQAAQFLLNPCLCSKYCTSITMDSGEREQEARQHADEQHIPRQAAAGQRAAQYLLKSLSLLKILYVHNYGFR